MHNVTEKAYGASGLLLIIISLLNSFFGVGELRHSYIFMCIGLFLFFDSLNSFLIDQESLLTKKISLLEMGLFVVFFGAVTGFFLEFYAAYLAGIWEGFFTSDIEGSILLGLANRFIDMTLVYGVLVLPAYSIFRILNRVFDAEVMLSKEFEASDYFKYFVHAGILLLAAPFTLLFLEFGATIRFIMFILSILGLLLVIEYFEFRKKGQGIIINLVYGNFDRFGAVMITSVLMGSFMGVLNTRFGLWSTEAVPLSDYMLFETPLAIFLVWTLVIAVISSGFNLVSGGALKKLNPEQVSETP